VVPLLEGKGAKPRACVKLRVDTVNTISVINQQNWRVKSLIDRRES